MYEFAYKEIVDESPQAMRAQEQRALDQVIGLLRAAAKSGPALAKSSRPLFQFAPALAIFLEDLKSPENKLPPPLRARALSR